MSPEQCDLVIRMGTYWRDRAKHRRAVEALGDLLTEKRFREPSCELSAIFQKQVRAYEDARDACIYDDSTSATMAGTTG